MNAASTDCEYSAHAWNKVHITDVQCLGLSIHHLQVWVEVDDIETITKKENMKIIIGAKELDGILAVRYGGDVVLDKVTSPLYGGEPSFCLSDGSVLDLDEMDELLSAHYTKQATIEAIGFSGLTTDKLELKVELLGKLTSGLHYMRLGDCENVWDNLTSGQETLTKKENNTMNALQKKFVNDTQESLAQASFERIAAEALRALDGYTETAALSDSSGSIGTAQDGVAQYEEAFVGKTTMRELLLDEKFQEGVRNILMGAGEPVGDDAALIVSTANSCFNVARDTFLAEFAEFRSQF